MKAETRDILECKHKDLLVKIMQAMYTYYGLSTKAVTRYFTFDSSKTYTMISRYLRPNNLITTKPQLGRHGNKLTSVYFLTQKGIDYLLENGYAKYYRRANNNTVQVKDLAKLNALNDLYFTLDNSWNGVPARDYKVSGTEIMLGSEKVKGKGARLHNNSYVDSVFYNNETNTAYFAYYMFEHNKNHINKIIKELIRHQDNVDKVIMICQKPETLELVQEKINRKLSSRELFLLRLHVISSDMARFTLNSVLTPSSLQNMVKKFHPDWQGSKTHEQTFAKLLLEKEGDRCYVSEFLSRDLALIKEMRRYTREKYEFHKKPVLLLSWYRDLEYLSDKLSDYRHIRIAPVSSNG